MIRQRSPVIFAEGFPPQEEWVRYEGQQRSTFWYGVVTTVDNMWYGITGGMKLRLLMLRPSWQFSASIRSGGIMEGTLTLPLPDMRGPFPFFGGEAARAYFREKYAPKAANEAVAVQAILKRFLSDTLMPY
eukprot:262058-Prymnesium_polylepis.1